MFVHPFSRAALLGVVFFQFAGTCTPSTAQEAKPSGIGEGFVLIAPLGSDTSYLINADKQVVHEWPCGSEPGNATYLTSDGSLIRTGKVRNSNFEARGGSGGSVQRISWEGQQIWKTEISDANFHAHHDVQPLPGGNVLVIAWDAMSGEEAIQAGRDPQTLAQGRLWPEAILEIKPVDQDDHEIVWQWRLRDHLIQNFDKSKANYGRVDQHPELVDINYGIRRGGADWIHMNAVHYHPELDQIALSARWFDEVWIIDHSTTAEEAAGHEGGRYGRGGDLLYRWGNPEAYFAGLPMDRQLFGQHDVRWIEPGRPGAGNLLLFNNGGSHERNFSSVDEFKPPLAANGSYDLSSTAAFAPEKFLWTYSDPGQFLSNRISGAERLPNGNTLICSGDQGWVFEVTPAGELVWQFELSEMGLRGGLFRAAYYPADFPGLKNRDLKPVNN